MRNKLNNLLVDLPKSAVATLSWLKTRGISRNLLKKYKNAGWMETVGRGAVLRKGDTKTWTGGVYALQQQLGLLVFPGGKTALNLKGYRQNVPMGRETIMLFMNPATRLPSWFTGFQWDADIVPVKKTLFPPDCREGITRITMGELDIRISSPERAILELLACLPGKEGVYDAKYLMGTLLTLSPAVLQALLENCLSIKVKRLFMVLAEAEDPPWLEKIDTRNVSFGKGFRSFFKGGVLHPKYRITVPSEWFNGEPMA